MLGDPRLSVGNFVRQDPLLHSPAPSRRSLCGYYLPATRAILPNAMNSLSLSRGRAVNTCKPLRNDQVLM